MKNKMTYKGVLFDLDGVIVSTDEFHFHAWSALAQREGIFFDKEVNNRLRGVSRRESLEIILEKSNKTYQEEDIQEMLTYKNDIYKESLSALSEKDILPGVLELIAFLKGNQIKVAIGSSSKNTMTILKYIGLSNTFDVIVDGTMIQKSKPDPEVFLLAASRCGLNPNECIVIEDALAGIESAKRAGMYAVAVSDALKSEQADFYAIDLLQVKSLF